jgi:hypothetical protein
MQRCKLGLAWFLILLLAIPNLVLGNNEKPDHVAPVDELRQALSSKAEDRARNVEEVMAFLHHENVRDYVGNVAELERIEAALPTLDDETLSFLATESAKANDELQAGLNTWIWVVIIVALVWVALALGNLAVNDN